MQLLGERLLLKAVKKEVLGIEEVDHYEVAYLGTKISKGNPLKVGDTVHYQMGVRVNILGEDYQLVNEDEVIAIL